MMFEKVKLFFSGVFPGRKNNVENVVFDVPMEENVDEKYIIKPKVTDTNRVRNVKNTPKNPQIFKKVNKSEYANNTTNPYRYYKDEQVFRSVGGKKSIPITAKEAIRIVTLGKQGFKYKDITKLIDFQRPISDRVVYNWIKKYNLGLMDKALYYICVANVEVEGVDYREIVHNKVGDICF